MIDDGIAAILRRDHHWSGNFLQDGGEEIYRNGTEGSNPACSGVEMLWGRRRRNGTIVAAL